MENINKKPKRKKRNDNKIDDGKLIFESAMEELEHITSVIMSGDIKISELSTLYQRAILLQKFCNAELDALKMTFSDLK